MKNIRTIIEYYDRMGHLISTTMVSFKHDDSLSYISKRIEADRQYFCGSVIFTVVVEPVKGVSHTTIVPEVRQYITDSPRWHLVVSDYCKAFKRINSYHEDTPLGYIVTCEKQAKPSECSSFKMHINFNKKGDLYEI